MLVASQAYIFLWSVVGGIAIAFIYDLFRIRRKAVRVGNILTYLEDLLYWLLVAVIIFGIIYFSNDGELRGYNFIGTALGVILYILLFSKAVMASAMFVINLIVSIFKLIWLVLSYPFKIIYKFTMIPVRFMGRQVSKSATGIKRAGRNRFSKVAIWRRMFKNIRKKI